MTPAELYIRIKIYEDQQQEKTKELLWKTWNTAALIRCDKMPELDEWMGIVDKDVKPKQQTTEQMISMAKLLNAAFGGEVVYI